MRSASLAAARLVVLASSAAVALGPGAPSFARARPAGARRAGAAEASAAAAHPALGAAGAAPERLAPLHEAEARLRAATDFRRVTAGDQATGADPFLLRALPGGGGRLVGLLRGSAEVVLLDADLRVTARLPAPRSPTGLAVSDGGDVFVSGALSGAVARFQVEGAALRRTGTIDLGAGRAIRDLAAGPGDRLYAVDERGGRLVTMRVGATAPDGAIAVEADDAPVGRGPIHVARVGAALVVDCLLDHTLVVLRLDGAGRPSGVAARIRHDGPIWSSDAVRVPAAGGDLVLAAGGVEDHPLDRTIGSFGYIDSFLTLYRVPAGGAAPPERLAVVNLSALGVVTPKVIALEPLPGGGLRALVTGYGSPARAVLTWGRDWRRQPDAAVAPFVPGTTALVARDGGALTFADPLLDAWVAVRPDGSLSVAHVAGARDGERRPLARVGEALFFTTLMAPWNSADGPSSRFTCETCHFEGYVDGRTHHTGRGDVHATTKPLHGLFNNRPYFSRALDPDLTTMVNNEFRVAGAKNGHDPWFAVRTDDFPWLRDLGVRDPELSPLALREALMAFLMDFAHAPNPAAPTGARFTDQQRAGAALFRARCEGCHQARLRSDDAASRAPFDAWEALIASEADPLVWGLDEYRKTGVVPYVNDAGARVPSLRRLYKKAPYFTNGSAKDLDDVIARARFDDAGGFLHDGGAAPAGRFDPGQARALRAFLDLL
jgi:hypothetical protein